MPQGNNRRGKLRFTTAWRPCIWSTLQDVIPAPKARHGFTLVELMLTLAILFVLASVAVPSYRRHLDNQDTAKAIIDIQLMEFEICKFVAENDTYPDNLDDIGMAGIEDPWGKPYCYLNMATATVGQMRKDHFMVPVNSDYDLYSMGKDGTSASPFTAAISQDDIVRANNGSYIGLVAEY